MCGIAVILPGASMPPPAFAIDRMTAALHHRGPDESGIFRYPDCQLGHTRLSIIDLAGGKQPMTDPTGRFTLVFNGEIYNYRDLRRELERAGICFLTHSDTEVLLQGFIHWGEAVIPRLNGQFAFAIWDAREKSLHVARDRFGEKPLYWSRALDGAVVVASEIKAILASGLIEPTIDRMAVDAYLGLFYVPPHRTIYDNVHTLSAAHLATFRDGKITERRYWSPRLSCHDVDEPGAVARIAQLIERAVDRQRVADVQIGAFLSGGLDSTTIVAHMARQSSQPVRTFAVGFGDLIDELPFARTVADAYHTEHHELQMNIDVPAMLHQMLSVYDEPFADSSNIPTYLVAAHARRHVKVVLSGDGGDELFGGYDWYNPLLRDDPSLPDGWARHVDGATGLLFDRSILWGDGRQPKAAEDVRARHRTSDDRASALDHATAFDLSCYLPGDILVKVDRAAMAHGLETRAPFLDAELADFVLGLPSGLRFSPSGGLKRLLRLACAELWPEIVRGRGKQGFGAPVRNWIDQPALREMWRQVTRPSGPLLALLPGVGNVELQLRPQRKWSLLCLGLWLEGKSRCLAKLP